MGKVYVDLIYIKIASVAVLIGTLWLENCPKSFHGSTAGRKAQMRTNNQFHAQHGF